MKQDDEINIVKSCMRKIINDTSVQCRAEQQVKKC